MAGQSQIARVPTVPELAERIRERAPYTGPSSATVIRYPHAPLRERVWDLRHNLTAYDATYLALAEALDDSVLLTANSGLASRARESLGEDRVRHVP